MWPSWTGYQSVTRRVAHTLNLKLTGALGLLIDAKRAGIISSVEPWLS
jgi:predicted nucleic acid-binding protein